MAQVLLYEENERGDSVAYCAIPSLDPRSEVEGALLWITDAVNVATRKPVKIRAIGTGEK